MVFLLILIGMLIVAALISKWMDDRLGRCSCRPPNQAEKCAGFFESEVSENDGEDGPQGR